jgi:hypothetical protein
MIISHKHRFIFLKTRKTAGTSIEIALSRFCGDEDIITPISRPDERLRQELSYPGPQNFDVLASRNVRHDGRPPTARKRIGYYNHMPAERVRGLIGPKIWDEYFKFCFERNPWDKAISLYFWQTRDQPRSRPSLLEFLRAEDQKCLSKGRTCKLTNFGIYSIGQDIVVDHIGLYEYLDDELERVAAVLNLPEGIELPRAKVLHDKDRRHYREVMGHEERSIVARICAREIAHLGYSF